MIPIRDVIPSRTTPWVTIALVGANLLIFLRQVTLPAAAFEAVLYDYGVIPATFPWGNVVTSMFVHAGWIHVLGNVLALWIFGDNVEDRMGHARFFLFYLLTGVVATLVHVTTAPDSTAPLVGASGAIAGVLGAYLVLFPRSRVLVLVFLVLFVDVVEIPALFFLALWFALQVLGGAGRTVSEPITGAIALWVHAAGFLAGAAAVWLFRKRERLLPGWWS